MTLILRMIFGVLLCVAFGLYAYHRDTEFLYVAGGAFLVLLLMLITQPRRPAKGKGN